MSQGEFGSRIPFEILQSAQDQFRRLGYYFLPVEREHTEGQVTQPLVARLRGQVKKRGFSKVAGRALITFSGYERDPREVQQVPEIRSYWRKLDSELTELPALVAYLPEAGFNGPGMHLMLLGDVDEMVHRPELGGYDVHVLGAERIIEQAIQRIAQASTKYGLSHNQTTRLTANFIAGVTFRLPPR